MSFEGLTILLVEDDQLLRASFAELLKLNKFNVLTAEDGSQALQVMQQTVPDLILCDRMMQVMSGDELVSLVRNDGRLGNIPFIFISAKSSRDDVRAGMNSGADDYLTKPFKASELLAAVEARLKRHLTERVKPEDMQQAQKIRAALSKQEWAIFTLIAQGKSSAEIADTLFISLKTVENHRSNISIKLGLSGKNSLLRFALEQKLVIGIVKN